MKSAMSKFLESGHSLIIDVGADLPNTIDDARVWPMF
jgi:hypothetical protein